MKRETIAKIREALDRCERREIDAMTALYRVDDILGEQDSQYSFEHGEEISRRVEEVFGS